MIGKIVTSAVGALAGPTADMVGNWQARKTAAQENVHRWEQKQIDQNSWVDEFWTLIFAFPLVSAFIPHDGLQAAIEEGWVIIEQSPDWYVAGLGLAWSAAFAVRGFRLVRGRSGHIEAKYSNAED